MMKFRDLLPSVVNLVNSSIGVGMLAMPYCFHQCGIILALVVLVFSGFFTIFASESVLRAGLFFHCSSFEDSAYKSHGVFGKRLVGLSLIGLLFGMLVGFNVSISDMGSDLVFACGLPKLFTGNPLKHVRWWRLDGLVHCLPVIASSLCCQVQVHVIYNSLRDQTHGNMRKALTYAVTFVISAYALAGLFGYLAFIEVEEEDAGEGGTLAGNMLTMYPENFVSALVRLGFLYTVTASFPLMLFPLRSALNSLLFEEPPLLLCPDPMQTAGDSGPISSVKELPLMRFRLMTLLVILLSIVVSQCTDKANTTAFTTIFSFDDQQSPHRQGR
nr:unnamed protein product [Spirometra erinaceieuropaei]